MRFVSLLAALVAASAFGAPACAAEGADGVDFERQVRPILAENCFKCHGADEAARQADVRLDQFRFAIVEGESGAKPIVPGKSAESELIRRITSDDELERMPPVDSEKTLKPEEIEILRRWIDGGARYADHWAFRAPERPVVPTVEEKAWPRNDVDRFVLARLEQEKLPHSPEASKETLLRRLSLDLTGLPPTVEEMDAYLADSEPGAYERQVDRLLASPHYGEKWARMWLDGARYADSDGYEKDLPRAVWMYRDWVTSALNRDLPYDVFLTQQLAGDLLPNAGQDERIATGFLRNSTINEEGGIDPEQFRMEGNFERMDILGKAVLGLTINCCQCHTHKYDPMPHEEYYRLMAYFNEAEEVTAPAYTAPDLKKRDRVLAGIRKVEARLQAKRPDWRTFLAAWAQSVRGDQPKWEALPLLNAGDNAQRFRYNDDKSVTGWGYNPPNTYLEYSSKLQPRKITAFRLEALCDPLSPKGGPGRSPRGLFALTEFYVDVVPPEDAKKNKAAETAPKKVAKETGDKEKKAEDEGKPNRLKFASASADFGNADMLLNPLWEDPNNNLHRVTGQVRYAIDEDDKTAWGVDEGPGRSNVDRKAVFVLDKPLELKPGESLKFTLRHDHGGYNPDERYANTIGRVRISTTDAANPVADPLPKPVRELVERPLESWTAGETAEAFSYWRTLVPEWRAANDEIEALWKQHPEGTTQLEFASRDGGRETHVLERGDFLKQGEKVEPGGLSMLHPLPEGAPRNRLGLAQWLTDRKAPTTARSIVNRVWQSYFGVGLVNTPEDFGTQGELPTNQALLDWLAVELMDRQWSLKELQRLIVTSAAYRQSSHTSPELLARDPANRLLARGPRHRVDGETIRDVALTASGLLNEKLGGPPMFPPAPAFMFLPPASYGPKTWIETTGPERYRRGLYTFRYRSVPYPVLTTLDTPTGDAACVRRVRSNTPLQALATLNETISMECARSLALRALEHTGADEKRMVYAFRRCTGREPERAELYQLMSLLEDESARLVQEKGDPWLLAANDPKHPPMLPPGTTPQQAAAWTAVSRVLLNLDETVTKE